MKYLRWLLLPFSLLYGLVVLIRNWCYDVGWFKSTSFNLPVISVGNLAVGGAGKSPMTEYLIRLLKQDYKVATLSRGYGRETKGFLVADATTTAQQVGDEPAQFKQKFPDITVAVCEDRVAGIEKLKADHNLILMDDAYQHRAVKPGLSILLFDYNKLNKIDFLLPAGNMREPISGKMRADIMVVSKCPDNLSTDEQENIAAKLNPYPYQHLLFTSINYLPLEVFGQSATVNSDTRIYLLTGLAGTQPLEKYLKSISKDIIHHKYPDHHQYTLKNITKLAEAFSADTTKNKAIVTTEKDAERLKQPALFSILQTLPVLVLPISVKFINGGSNFDQLITSYVREYTTHSSVH
ncbi:tetraacyldisaccharide 4'-kinase [Mucilaginibacter sp. KACC 22063]|uniref:tetraacyldisaccharide 4'-kinase n=1 Tax=Mucilaginibacter sp. KACC 22063 TaxID=3025666 RepID=UPI0023668C15|nr:tetraacyldisaccharide 4'-kinase [Mucilaginibacter sp. KACC 22063]WDF54773.1 tetraacyldisaccharide 4'-kinase [Mucilaginibacter sp. KACC 22063]